MNAQLQMHPSFRNINHTNRMLNGLRTEEAFYQIAPKKESYWHHHFPRNYKKVLNIDLSLCCRYSAVHVM